MAGQLARPYLSSTAPLHFVGRTCNVSRTVVTQTLATTFYTNSLYGKHSKCSVRSSPFHRHTLANPSSSWRNALSVSTFLYTSSLLVRFSPATFAFILGFLPVLYTWSSTRRNPAPVFLPSESDQDEQLQAKPVPPSQDLRGWKLLLLWFPAVCDLTGTTVRNSLFPLSHPSSITISRV